MRDSGGFQEPSWLRDSGGTAGSANEGRSASDRWDDLYRGSIGSRTPNLMDPTFSKRAHAPHITVSKIVPESNVFISLRIALSEKQIPRFVGNVSG
jgi:hypothetical protein